jgi:predicted transcriptional regulator
MSTISDIVKEFNLKVFAGKSKFDNPVTGAYVSDLLSDVMGNAKDENLWITLQTHKNIIAVASLRDLSAIICVKGFIPDQETIETADQENIPLLGTELNTFEMAGKLYNYLNR